MHNILKSILFLENKTTNNFRSTIKKLNTSVHNKLILILFNLNKNLF